MRTKLWESREMSIVYVAIFFYICAFVGIRILEHYSLINIQALSFTGGGENEIAFGFPFFILFFSVIFSILFYLANSLIARRLIEIDLRTAIIYMSACGFIAPVGEYIINAVSFFMFHQPIYI